MNETAAVPAPRPSRTAAEGILDYCSSLVPRTHRSARVARITAILAIAALADVFLAIPAFNGVLKSNPIVSFFCALAFVVVTVMAAIGIGRALRREHRHAAWGLAAAVLLLIVGLFVLRMTAAELNSSGASFEGAATSHEGALAELPIAAVFAALMIATSILAAVDGWEMTLSREQQALQEATDELARLDTQLAALEGEQVRQVENEAIAIGRIARLDDDWQVALDGLQAFARELQQLARTEVARHLGSPTATSGLDVSLGHAAELPARTTASTTH